MRPFTAGLIAVVLIAAATYFAFTKNNPFSNPYVLNAVFENTNRLANRSPVRIAGVEVGQVVNVEPLADGSGLVRVKMEIADEGLPIKKDAQLKVRSRLFLEGNYFVDLQPGTPGSENLDDGDTVPPNQTASPVQFGATAHHAAVGDARRTCARCCASTPPRSSARAPRASTRRSSTGRTPTATPRRSTTPPAARSPTTSPACSRARRRCSARCRRTRSRSRTSSPA